MKKVTLSLLALLGAANLASAQTARVQIIHNSADAAAETVDIWANSDLLEDDFEFRTATPYQDLPAGVPITVGIAGPGSTMASDAFATVPVTFTAGMTYVVVANGIYTTGSDYSPASTAAPFNLYVAAYGREESAEAGETDVLVFHGATDAPTVNIDAVGAGTIVPAISWSEFDDDYLELANADYTLNVTTTGGDVVKSYQAPLATLGLADSAIVVLASGFLDPSVNDDGEEFGLWVALPEGGDLIELPESEAKLQVIHNSADAAVASVDVYLNDELLLPAFSFRNASAYVPVLSEVDHMIGFALAGSTDADDTLFAIPVTLASNETYVAIANGQVSTMGYSPSVGFALDVFAMGREGASTTGNTDVLVYHGSTDAPTVDIDEATAGNLVDNISYGEFDADYLELATADYIIQVKDDMGSSVLFSYSAPLATLGLTDAAIVVCASGFVDPTVNSDGPAFGLWVALPAGGAMVELPVAFASIEEMAVNFGVFPNPATDVINISGIQNSASVTLFNTTGAVVSTQIIGSNGVLDVTELESGLYIAKIKEGNSEQIVKFTVQ
ncbi:MAG: DUF4397 domain-containing protein [Crocinitomicaceae bacterium]|nr:DUF4397 domain-containing protein [Crocinitomicaceae bacterium]